MLFKQICHANARGTYFESKHVQPSSIDIIIIIIIIIIINIFNNPNLENLLSVKHLSQIKFNKCYRVIYRENGRRKKNITNPFLVKNTQSD